MNITALDQSPNYICRIRPGRGGFINATDAIAEVQPGDVLVKTEEGPWFAQYRKVEDEPEAETPIPSGQPGQPGQPGPAEIITTADLSDPSDPSDKSDPSNPSEKQDPPTDNPTEDTPPTEDTTQPQD